jgi:hypothetical protein
MDGWKDDWSREYKKGKGGTPGAWATQSSVQIRDKRKYDNKGQRKQDVVQLTCLDVHKLVFPIFQSF